MIRLTYILILLVIVYACEERYDPILERLEIENYIINGYINQSSTDPYIVTIEQTNASEPPTKVFNACVEVVDEDGNREEFIEAEIGTYVSEAKIVKGQPGMFYFLEVKMQTGEVFRSRPDIMPSLLLEDELTWDEENIIFTSEFGTDVSIPHVTVDLKARIPSTPDLINTWWVLEETFQFNEVDFPDPFGSIPPSCYVIQTYGAGDINLFTKAGYESNLYNASNIFVRNIDESFLTKHIFSTYQHSVSNEFFEYLESIEALVENSGSLFDTPPGLAVGNFDPVSGTDKKPLGYFSAVLTDTVRIAVYPTELSTLIQNKCAFIEGKSPVEYEPQCRDCEIVPRSSKQRPKYWTQL